MMIVLMLPAFSGYRWGADPTGLTPVTATPQTYRPTFAGRRR